jgi:hypothetical protein
MIWQAFEHSVKLVRLADPSGIPVLAAEELAGIVGARETEPRGESKCERCHDLREGGQHLVRAPVRYQAWSEKYAAEHICRPASRKSAATPITRFASFARQDLPADSPDSEEAISRLYTLLTAWGTLAMMVASIIIQ